MPRSVARWARKGSFRPGVTPLVGGGSPPVPWGCAGEARTPRSAAPATSFRMTSILPRGSRAREPGLRLLARDTAVDQDLHHHAAVLGPARGRLVRGRGLRRAHGA